MHRSLWTLVSYICGTALRCFLKKTDKAAKGWFVLRHLIMNGPPTNHLNHPILKSLLSTKSTVPTLIGFSILRPIFCHIIMLMIMSSVCLLFALSGSRGNPILQLHVLFSCEDRWRCASPFAREEEVEIVFCL